MSMRPTRFAGFFSSPARSPNAALISFTVIPPLNASASRARRAAALDRDRHAHANAVVVAGCAVTDRGGDLLFRGSQLELVLRHACHERQHFSSQASPSARSAGGATDGLAEGGVELAAARERADRHSLSLPCGVHHDGTGRACRATIEPDAPAQRRRSSPSLGRRSRPARRRSSCCSPRYPQFCARATGTPSRTAPSARSCAACSARRRCRTRGCGRPSTTRCGRGRPRRRSSASWARTARCRRASCAGASSVRSARRSTRSSCGGAPTPGTPRPTPATRSRVRRRRRSWPPASRTSTPTCCRAAAGCRDRGPGRPPVAVAALPEPPAAADGGAVVVRRKRRGISAATRVPAPKRATAAEILIHDALESQPRRRATLKKLCRALKARPVAAAMLGAPLKARVREVLRRRTDLFEKVKAKKAPAADGDGGGAAPKKAVRWTVAATSPLAATSGAPAPSENSARQSRT